jgi:hypothetical protein
VGHGNPDDGKVCQERRCKRGRLSAGSAGTLERQDPQDNVEQQQADLHGEPGIPEGILVHDEGEQNGGRQQHRVDDHRRDPQQHVICNAPSRKMQQAAQKK